MTNVSAKILPEHSEVVLSETAQYIRVRIGQRVNVKALLAVTMCISPRQLDRVLELPIERWEIGWIKAIRRTLLSDRYDSFVEANSK
jgi:hypothetical protein